LKRFIKWLIASKARWIGPYKIESIEKKYEKGETMINIGVVGYGYWGPNIVRNFIEVSGSQVTALCDLKNDQLEKATARYPTIKTTTNFDDLVSNKDIDAIAVVTPVSSHYDLALKALQAGKHVLVEKPLTETSAQARELIDEAESRNLVLMVDHTFVYTGAVRKLKELVTSGSLGEVFYYDSTRVNLGLFQHDVNVLWDLAVHDLSIMEFVLPAKPIAVSATGISHVNGEPANTAYLTVFFKEPIIAHINVNWLAPVKIRSTLLGGSKQMVVYDDLEPSEKVKIYDKGIVITNDSESIYQMLVGYRTGDMWAPKLDSTEALRTEALHFIACIQGEEKPITDGKAGLGVVRILEAATESMENCGKKVEL
jgi:predicted dehydrogenase